MNYVKLQAPDTIRSDFHPIEALSRLDADTMLVFLSGDGIGFFNTSRDPWYRTTVKSGRVFYFENDTLDYFRPEEASSPLGCIQQFQFCNPSLPQDTRCGPLASWHDSLIASAALFDIAEEEMSGSNFPDHEIGSWFAWLSIQMRLGSANIQNILSSLGARALESQKYLAYGIMGAIPENQWQTDVSQWFSIHLSSLQAGVVNSALGPSDPALNPYKVFPPNEHVRRLCNSQVS